MRLYRIFLILLHICSSLCYLPHLFVHIKYLSFHTLPFQSKLAYLIYWFNYCLLALIILLWCVFVVYRKQASWELIQVSGYVLITKLIYTMLDVTTRILLRYKCIVIVFDILHIIILFSAILITRSLVHHVKINWQNQ